MLTANGAVYFTVPYDKGWSAYVNGNKADILDCGGMMGLLLSPGEYSLAFKYQVPGLKAGAVIGVVSFCVLFP